MKSGDNELKHFQQSASQCGKFKEVKLKLLKNREISLVCEIEEQLKTAELFNKGLVCHVRKYLLSYMR